MSLLTRAPQVVGTITFAVGAALTARPQLATGPLGLEGQERAIRAIGLSDLVVAAGLLRSRPAWPWMTARAALNLVLIAYFEAAPGLSPGMRSAGRRTFRVLSVLDGGTALALKRIEAS
jgi:hypothetical protein